MMCVHGFVYVCVFIYVYIYIYIYRERERERDLGLIPGLGKFPGEGTGNPLQYSFLENPYGQRRLAGYSPWGRKSQTRLSN